MAEREFARDIPFRRVCLRCRRVHAGRTWMQRTAGGRRRWSPAPENCPECRSHMPTIAHSTKVPKRRDVRAWEDLASSVDRARSVDL